MRVSISSAATLLGVLVSTVAGAQSVDDLVARNVEARGGYEKLKTIQTIKITRTVATPFSSVAVVIYKKRPQLYRAEQGPKGQPPAARGINPDAAWDTSAGGASVRRPAQAAAETRELDADFDGLLVDWKAKGRSVTLEGRESLPGGDAYKLKVATRSGPVRYVYLDARTYLDRRQTGVNDRQEAFVQDFSNWQVVDGVRFPFNIDEDRKGPQITQSFATYTEKIELNVPMDDALFATPAGTAGPGG